MLPAPMPRTVAGILEILLGFWAAQQYLSVKGALLLV